MQHAATRAEGLPPAAAAGVTQAGAAALAVLPLVAGLEASALEWAVLQAAIALRIATLAGAPRWWLPLHLAFVPGLVCASSLSVSPGWWATGFAALMAIFGTTFRTQVPLFLAGERVTRALVALLPSGRRFSFVDLGCGLGGVLTRLKLERPDGDYLGVDLAPLPYLVSRVRAGSAGCRVERRDLMSVDLARFDVVYAFLSPAPMPGLWAKAKREMRPGTLLVSVAFEVPGVEPDEVIRLSDAGRHTLYLWRM